MWIILSEKPINNNNIWSEHIYIYIHIWWNPSLNNLKKIRKEKLIGNLKICENKRKWWVTVPMRVRETKESDPNISRDLSLSPSHKLKKRERKRESERERGGWDWEAKAKERIGGRVRTCLISALKSPIRNFFEKIKPPLSLSLSRVFSFV